MNNLQSYLNQNRASLTIEYDPEGLLEDEDRLDAFTYEFMDQLSSCNGLNEVIPVDNFEMMKEFLHFSLTVEKSKLEKYQIDNTKGTNFLKVFFKLFLPYKLEQAVKEKLKGCNESLKREQTDREYMKYMNYCAGLFKETFLDSRTEAERCSRRTLKTWYKAFTMNPDCRDIDGDHLPEIFFKVWSGLASSPRVEPIKYYLEEAKVLLKCKDANILLMKTERNLMGLLLNESVKNETRKKVFEGFKAKCLERMVDLLETFNEGVQAGVFKEQTYRGFCDQAEEKKERWEQWEKSFTEFGYM
tara:strand:- start:1859 stop:2761 length:903 start_codon:yes stop_codon:yes gene_type:complete